MTPRTTRRRTKPPDIVTFDDGAALQRRDRFLSLYKTSPIPDSEVMQNLGLFLTPSTLSRVLLMDFLYRRILDVQGAIMEFGCRWGQSLSLFLALRGIYEPYNRVRQIVGFDTFSGFPGTSAEDGPAHGRSSVHRYSVTKDYASYLQRLLACQEAESPLAHIKRHEIVKGNAPACLRKYFAANPETIVALAYFDLDLYKPTADCLRLLRRRLTRGSVIGFDELNEHAFPGETRALMDVFGLGRYAIRRFRHNSRSSYIVID